MEVEELEDPGKHISETKNSEQLKRLLDEVDETYPVQDEIEESAVKTSDEYGSAVVSSISYGLGSDTDGIFLDVNSCVLENGERETVGYVLDGDSLITEYHTSDDIMPDCESEEYDGSVILGSKVY